MVGFLRAARDIVFDPVRLQSRQLSLQTGVPLRRAPLPVGSEMDWTGHLDSYSNGGVVDRRFRPVLPERKDLVFGYSSAARHAPRRFHP